MFGAKYILMRIYDFSKPRNGGFYDRLCNVSLVIFDAA